MNPNEHRRPRTLSNWLLGAILTVMVGQFGGGIWWAATISTKVEFIVSTQNAASATATETAARVSAHETRIQLLEASQSRTEQRLGSFESRHP